MSDARFFVTAIAAFLAIIAGGMALFDQPAAMVADGDYPICGSVRENCVVDGDTVWLDGEKIRIADIDTPEIFTPDCDREKQLGEQARDRMRELMNASPFEVATIGDRNEDRYGRKLRVLVRDGQSLGDILVSEGLARTWTGQREPWC